MSTENPYPDIHPFAFEVLTALRDSLPKTPDPAEEKKRNRDWFAGYALMGLLAGEHVSAAEGRTWAQQVAADAYEIADAMIKRSDA